MLRNVRMGGGLRHLLPGWHARSLGVGVVRNHRAKDEETRNGQRQQATPEEVDGGGFLHGWGIVRIGPSAPG